MKREIDTVLGAEARVFADLESLSRAAAEESARAVGEAVRSRGRCLIALSGGHTPSRMYELWATEYREKIPWGKVHFFWGDERFVPADDPKSNYRMAKLSLLDRVPVQAENIHPVVTSYANADEAAQVYENTLRRFFGDAGPTFDILFLGMGGEGHTASLFPDSPALAEQKRWVVGVRAPVDPPVRVSLTFPVLRRARETFFLIAGADKKGVIEELTRDPKAAGKKFPVAMLRPEGRAIWFLDQAAYP
ncbi:MAG TPA: 6-phosphogluconolactonase [Candidatus Acidoferrales bacterium]|nr:6-phosphogluconolactonase [Candidatus Acidoferrales bacterium]